MLVVFQREKDELKTYLAGLKAGQPAAAGSTVIPTATDIMNVQSLFSAVSKRGLIAQRMFYNRAIKAIRDAGGAAPAANITALPAGWFAALLAALPQILAFVAQILSWFGIVPKPAATAVKAINWTEILHAAAEEMPIIVSIVTDAMAGMSAADLVTKYSQKEVQVAEEILGQLAT